MRWSSLVMLETTTVFLAVAGLVLLAGRLRQERPVSRWRAVLVGVAFGLSMLKFHKRLT